MRAVAIDIGGSSVKSGVLEVRPGNGPMLSARDSEALPSNRFADLQSVVYKLVKDLLADLQDGAVVGISTTGSVDRKGIVVSAGHFDGYTNVSWAELLTGSFPEIAHVTTVNDGRAGTWAEYRANSTPVNSHIHVAVGTGVGGGIVHDGELLLGDSGQAGYIGHIKISLGDTATCSCGSQGCVETLASGPAVVRAYVSNKDRTNRDEQITFDLVVDAAKAGDRAAIESFEVAGWMLGRGLGNAMNVLNPVSFTQKCITICRLFYTPYLI